MNPNRDDGLTPLQGVGLVLFCVVFFGGIWFTYIKVSDWIFDWRMGTCQEKGYSQEACALRLRSN